jgi:hypothetical protein
MVKRTLVEFVRETWASWTANPKEISLRRRVALWIAAWAVAGLVLVIATHNPFIVVLFYSFPMGLPGLFDSDPRRIPAIILIGGWLLYIGLTFYGVRRRDWRQYFVFYAILLLLLAINVGGCRAQISGVHF